MKKLRTVLNNWFTNVKKRGRFTFHGTRTGSFQHMTHRYNWRYVCNDAQFAEFELCREIAGNALDDPLWTISAIIDKRTGEVDAERILKFSEHEVDEKQFMDALCIALVSSMCGDKIFMYYVNLLIKEQFRRDCCALILNKEAPLGAHGVADITRELDSLIYGMYFTEKLTNNLTYDSINNLGYRIWKRS